MALEFWTSGSNVPGEAANIARKAIADGFDGITFGDTLCVNADPYVGLTVAAHTEPELKLALGVTNPVTRHPAVTACAIASVQLESKGRAVLGIGRGDSGVSKLNLPAATVDQFERHLVRLQGYLSGEVIDADGRESSLEWLKRMNLPKVPVDVAATGPQMIAVGARHAERLSLNVGADRERLARAIDLARDIRKGAGRPVDSLSFGTYIPVAPHPDIRAARELAKGVTAVYARFQAMRGHSTAHLSADDARVIKAVGDNYDRSRHGRPDAAHIAYLDDDFVDRFAVVGTPEQCVEKLHGLVALGLDRVMVVGPSRMGDPDDYAESFRLLAREVLPEVRRRAARH